MLTPVASQPFEFSFRTFSFAAMPRITVKGLTAQKKVLEEDIETLLQKNDKLQAELESRRDRSRSRHRKAEFKVEPISARTLRALDIVCKRDRDPVIDEQRKTIAKQAQEIEALKRGEGAIGPVLLAVRDQDGLPEILRDNLLKRTETVKAFFKRTQSLVSGLTHELNWAYH